MAISRLESIMNSASGLSPEFQKVFQASIIGERKPIQTLEEKKEKLDTKLSLLNDIIGKVDTVKKVLPDISTPGSMLEVVVKSNDERVVTGIAEKGKAPLGDFNVEVLQLATPATIISNGFPDKDQTTVGSGYITLTDPTGESREIFVDDSNATLEGLARVINSADVGVRATVINDSSDPESPFKLMLTGTKPGTENDIMAPEFSFIDGEEELYIEDVRPAANALVRFEGREFESPSNELKEVVPGVSLQLKGISDGRPVTVHVEQDLEKTSGKVKQLVEGLNEVFSFIQQQVPNETTDTSRTLGNDYGLKVAEQRLRTALFQAGSSDPRRKYKSLADIGIQFERNGTLKLDEKKLNTALQESFPEVADILIGENLQSGFVPRVSRALQTISSPGLGVLTNQKQNYTEQTKRLDRQIDDKERFLEKKAESLKNKLAKAQGAISALQSQSGRLAAAIPLGSLPG